MRRIVCFQIVIRVQTSRTKCIKHKSKPIMQVSYEHNKGYSKAWNSIVKSLVSCTGSHIREDFKNVDNDYNFIGLSSIIVQNTY